MDIFKLSLKNKDQNEQEEKQLAESLNFLESVLKEEDPEFVNNLAEIKSDKDIKAIKEDPLVLSNVAQKNKVSVLESAVELNIKKNSFSYILFEYLKQPFLIKKNPKKVILFWLLCITVVVGAYFVVKTKFWVEKDKLLIHSYEEWGAVADSFDLTTQADSYFDNPNFTKNVMTLSKLTTNILPSENSSENPMVSYEVVLESLSSDAIVEIKDREAEFRDLVLRTVEEFNYDELTEPEGKQKLSEMTVERINATLTKSQIRRVYYNNFVIKY